MTVRPDYDGAAIRLLTPIRIQAKSSVRTSGELDPTVTWTDVGILPGETVHYKRCQWINAHGSEALAQDLARAKARATVVIRYDPGVNQQCRILLNEQEWAIVAPPDNVRLGNRYMELIVERMVPA